MVIIFSERKSAAQQEIINLLCAHGARYISDRSISESSGNFTVISEYGKTKLKLKHATVIMLDNTNRFAEQEFPSGIIGICEDSNAAALKLFCKNSVPVVSCGMSAKNTITVSSLSEKTFMISLQRRLKDAFGRIIEPGEYKIETEIENCSPFSAMASVAALLLEGITPNMPHK